MKELIKTKVQELYVLAEDMEECQHAVVRKQRSQDHVYHCILKSF